MSLGLPPAALSKAINERLRCYSRSSWQFATSRSRTMKRLLPTLFVLLMVSALTEAGDVETRETPARLKAQKAQLDRAQNEAREAFVRAMIAAKSAYLKEV